MERVLVGVDGSEPSGRAVALAAELAAGLGASLHVVHVVASAATGLVPRGLAEYEHLEHVHATQAELLRSAAEQTAAAAAADARLAGAGEVHTEVLEGDPASVLAERAGEIDADVLVVGRRGLGGLTGALLGSVSHKVIHHVACAVMTVP